MDLIDREIQTPITQYMVNLSNYRFLARLGIYKPHAISSGYCDEASRRANQRRYWDLTAERIVALLDLAGECRKMVTASQPCEKRWRLALQIWCTNSFNNGYIKDVSNSEVFCGHTECRWSNCWKCGCRNCPIRKWVLTLGLSLGTKSEARAQCVNTSDHHICLYFRSIGLVDISLSFMRLNWYRYKWSPPRL